MLATITATPAPEADAAWATRFDAFGAFHLLVLLAGVAAVVGACVLGRRWAGRRAEKTLRFTWVGFTIVWQTFAVAWFLVWDYDLATSLPLQLCDIAAWIAPLALLTQLRVLRAILYFWGIGLSTQAFITPITTDGFGHVGFWIFWLGHLQIVGSAIYDVAVLGYRPRFADLVSVVLISFGYLALVLVVNELTGGNYGYVGRATPRTLTIVDRLGPWPARVIWIGLIVQAVLFAAWAVWPAVDRLSRLRQAGGGE